MTTRREALQTLAALVGVGAVPKVVEAASAPAWKVIEPRDAFTCRVTNFYGSGTAELPWAVDIGGSCNARIRYLGNSVFEWIE